jgi:nucleotide-binding universal stress UspA family protein
LPTPHEPVFRRAVLGLTGGSSDERMIRIACQLAKPFKSEIIGVHVVEIDWTLPLDADVAGRDEDVQRVLDVAEGAAEDVGYTLTPVLLQARDVGAALVDEASERGADLLMLGLAYRTKFGGDFAVGQTIPYVLKNAPCAVWVVREPMPGGLA